MKKILALVLAVVMATFCLASCGDKKDSTSKFKIGVILVGDDSETYTKAHSDGIKEAAKELGISESDIEWKTKVADETPDDCYNAAKQLVASGCKLVISNSYGHQDPMARAAKEFKDVNFVSMTGDFAAISGLDNMFNAFTGVYEARYVSGIVAGLKVKELVDAKKLKDENFDKKGNVKIGYVGAYPYAEVVSGYTAFYLGIKSVVENVVMDVQYTSSWFSIEAEAAAAEALMGRGCVIIGQHADSTGAPKAVEKANKSGKEVYSVGYNMDMTKDAPTAALTSPTNTWSVCYKEILEAAKSGKKIPQDLAYGYEKDGVTITKLGKSCAKGTQEAVDKAIAAIKDGSLKVFDTANFTVGGKEVKTAEVDLSYYNYSKNPPELIYKGEKKDAIVKDGDTTYFDESKFRSAPYFALRIDGITELNAN